MACHDILKKYVLSIIYAFNNKTWNNYSKYRFFIFSVLSTQKLVNTLLIFSISHKVPRKRHQICDFYEHLWNRYFSTEQRGIFYPYVYSAADMFRSSKFIKITKSCNGWAVKEVLVKCIRLLKCWPN